jgi:hypothetical protein
MIPILALLWAAEDSKPPAWDTFAQYSVLGIAVLGFGLLLYRIFMQLWARSGDELTREVARGDRLEQENRALNAAMQDKAIPALLAAATAITDCVDLVRQLQRELERGRDYPPRRGDGEQR